jgi:hypothetical protein
MRAISPRRFGEVSGELQLAQVPVGELPAVVLLCLPLKMEHVLGLSATRGARVRGLPRTLALPAAAHGRPVRR